MEIFILAVLIGLIPAFVAQSKGHSFMVYWIFGALLFIVALPVALMMKKDQAELDRRAIASGQSKRCPSCSELVRAGATVCPHCARDIQSREPQALKATLSDPSSAGAVFLKGNEAFDFDIVGESFYQAALDGLAGGKVSEGHDLAVEVELVPDPDNVHDANAVKVMVDDKQVGSLSRDHAKAFRQRMARLGYGARSGICDAVICGGWKDRASEGHYGVKLDLVWPVRPAT